MNDGNFNRFEQMGVRMTADSRDLHEDYPGQYIDGPDVDPDQPVIDFHFAPHTGASLPGKLADVEVHFNGGIFDGLKLIGFAIWERRGGSGRNVTFPARQYTINGERRSFALLRPLTDARASDRFRDAILAAYAEHEAVEAARLAANVGAIAAQVGLLPDGGAE